MATSIQENLVKANKNYAADFKEGDLALPPAKKYAVGRSTSPYFDNNSSLGFLTLLLCIQ